MSTSAITIGQLGPWHAECNACEDESPYGDEGDVRAWAAAHACRGVHPCGCPRWLADEGNAPHYYGCSADT